jgi:hypothetical protein
MRADDPLNGVVDGLAGARRLAQPSRDLVADVDQPSAVSLPLTGLAELVDCRAGSCAWSLQ